jgi:hypothetical protein
MKNDNDELMKACAKYILGESSGVKLKGSPETLESFQRVLFASRDLYSALQQKRSLEEIRDLLEKKKNAAIGFKSTTGLTWRL